MCLLARATAGNGKRAPAGDIQMRAAQGHIPAGVSHKEASGGDTPSAYGGRDDEHWVKFVQDGASYDNGDDGQFFCSCKLPFFNVSNEVHIANYCTFMQHTARRPATCVAPAGQGTAGKC